MFRILLLVILLIVYGSTYPWDFQSRPLPANPLWILLTSWPAGLDRFAFRDIAVNLALYLPLGMFGFLAFAQRHRWWVAGAATVLMALALSSGMEMAQLFDRTRDTSALDVVTDVAGAAAGIAVAGLYRETLRRALSRRTTEMLFHPSGALLLLYGWIGYQTFPLFPALSRTQVALKAAALSFSPLEACVSFVEWMAVARLLEAVAGPKRARAYMVLLMLLVPCRILIAGRTFTWSEWIGAGAAMLAWKWLPGRTSLLAGLFILMLAVRGAAPFHFQDHAAAFSWIPLGGFLASNWVAGWVVFFQKIFWYGTALWLLQEAGCPLAVATAGVCMLLAGIEAVQVYLPGRSPEITDPLLAGIMAGILWLLDRHSSSLAHLDR